MTTTVSTSNAVKVNNGVNVDALLGAREALDQAPEAAQFKWRATCEWLNGTHSRSVIGGFFGLGSGRRASNSSRPVAFRIQGLIQQA